MSGRSKEKVTAALRKIFRSNNNRAVVTERASTAGQNPSVAVTNGNVDANGNPCSDKNSVTGAAIVLPKNNKNANINNNNNNNNGHSSESPGKRMRRKDNSKVGPSYNKHSVPQPSKEPNIRARRLMKEYNEIQRSQSKRQKPVFSVELVEDNLYEWYARLHVVDPDSRLAKDMIDMNIPHILLHLVFPDNFPFAPPFMRVVEPHIEKGFVMEGGAICMELLTPRGWASAYTVEAVIMQFSASLVKGQGRIIRKSKGSKEFSRRSAEEAFRSLVKTHEKYGWVTPSLSDG